MGSMSNEIKKWARVNGVQLSLPGGEKTKKRSKKSAPKKKTNLDAVPAPKEKQKAEQLSQRQLMELMGAFDRTHTRHRGALRQR